MRRITAIILSLFYLLIATNATVAIHKCMGAIESIELVQSEKVCCCGDLNMDNCCENLTVDFPDDKVEKVISNYSFAFANHYFQLIELPSIIVLEKNYSGEHQYAELEHPPISPVPVFIAHCSFTFYG